jgi:dTDP-6-deoxy-L-talose 4-dehydrogenase (NAD+)
MRLFVTGATGFIGSHLLRHALALGHEVVALRRSAESRPRIELQREPVWLTKPMDEVDAADFGGADCLVHLASVGISPRVASHDELQKWNVEMPVELLRTAARVGLKRWVVSGSFVEYGTAGLRYDLIPPDAPLEPTFSYAVSKAEGFRRFSQLAQESHARLAYLRLFSVFGEGQHEWNLWPLIRRAAAAGEDLPLTAGEQVRDFIAVEDVAKALLEAALDDSIEPGVPRVCNVGTGRPQKVRAFAEHWWREFGAQSKLLLGSLPYRDDEVMRYVPLVR